MLVPMYQQMERCMESIPAALVDGTVIFTITGGPIQILDLLAFCTVTNSGTATTVQWKSNPTGGGTATTFSGASGSLTSCVPGASVLLTPTALSTAPTIVLANAGGVHIGLVAQNHIIVHAGTITTVVTNSLASARWIHYLRFKPLGPSVQVN
jgi:hypothetical protein